MTRFLFLMGIFVINFNLKKTFLSILTLLLILSALFLTENKVKERMFYYTYVQIFIDDNKGSFNLFSPMHSGHYKSAFMMFTSNPIIGIGPKMFRHECQKPKYRSIDHACSSHPHNTYIQLLAETGIIGFIQIFSLFLFISYKLIKLFLKNNLSNNEIIIYFLLLSIFINLWPIIPTFNFFINWINIIFYLQIGFLLYFKKTHE